MRKVSINYATAWLMGIDPIATGKQLKDLRRSHNLTQEYLSELFEQGGDSASRVIISMWENGKKLPSLSHMVFLAELYGCSLDELVISYRRSREVADRDQPVPLFVYVEASVCNSYICFLLSSGLKTAGFFFCIIEPTNLRVRHSQKVKNTIFYKKTTN